MGEQRGYVGSGSEGRKEGKEEDNLKSAKVLKNFCKNSKPITKQRRRFIWTIKVYHTYAGNASTI